jgi:hypothetical protein
MKQYRKYPIYINYNRFTEEERVAELNRLQHDFYFKKPATPGRIGYDPNAGKIGNMLSPQAKQYFAEQEEARRKYGDNVYDYMPDILENQANIDGRFRDEVRLLKPTRESLNYEKNVTKQLDIIRSTAIGNLLLDSIKSSVKVWILLDQSGGHAAATTPGALGDDKGGGVRLYYEPDGFDPKMEYYTPDDVLFHELVHAYRASKGEHFSKALAEYETAEELLAIQMQNVYMSVRRKKKFYRSHSNPTLVTKNDAYAAIASDRDTLDAFNYFRRHELLAVKVAGMAAPPYNSWRDAHQVNSMGGPGTTPSIQRFGLPMTF